MFEDQLNINVFQYINIAQEVEFFVNDMAAEGYRTYKIVYNINEKIRIK